MTLNTKQTDLGAYTGTEAKSPDITPVEDDVEFPFKLVIGEKVITRISELSQDEKEQARRKKRVCSLCGSKEIEYEKETSRFSHLICAECATCYVRRACELNSKSR